MKILLISDLHLASERPAVTTAFINFLHEQAAQCEALYILGDLFEIWIGDDDSAPLARKIIGELKALSEAGTQLYVLHGNRDFSIGRRFCRETGASLIKEHQLVDLYGENVLLLHGDTLCTDDEDYQRARRRLRNPFLLWFLTSLPLALRRRLALVGRQKSKASTHVKAQYILDVNPEAVREALHNFGVSTMIHGHTHRPDDHKIELGNQAQGRRIVLGDWHEKGWFVEASSAGLKLQSFDI